MGEAAMVHEVKRWTAKRKVEVILDIMKGQTPLIEFCRQNDLKQSTVESWTEEFIKGGTRSLRINSADEKQLREAQLKEMKSVIGDLTLEVMVLKKAKELKEEEESESLESKGSSETEG